MSAAANDSLDVDGVECKPQKGGMLTVGINVPKPLRFPMKRKADKEATRDAVRKHPKFAAAVAALTDASTSTAAPQPPALSRELNALGLPAKLCSTAQPWRELYTECLECVFCLRHGASLPGKEPAYGAEGNIHVQFCPVCGVPMCDVTCSRRGPCPHFGATRPLDVPLEFRYRAYAELMAGIGCKCACCRLHSSFFMDGDGVEDFLHGDDTIDPHTERKLLRDSLAAVGNPDCWLKEVLLRCETCTGSCGLSMWGAGKQCGEADVKDAVRQLIDAVEDAHTVTQPNREPMQSFL